MQNFSVKVPDELHEKLERHLREHGFTRSGFVRELIERELKAPKASSDAGPIHPIARFRAVIEGPAGSRDDVLRVNELLAEGYGADGADP